MKRVLLCVILLVVTTSTNVYAWGFDLDASDGFLLSVGVTAPGIGGAFLRGDTGIVNNLKRDGYKRDYGTVSFAPAAQLDLMLSWFFFLGIETGVGYTRSSVAYAKEESGTKYEYRFKKEEITIPLMFRIQIPLLFLDGLEEASLYFSVGAKFGIPLNDNYVTHLIDGKETTLSSEQNKNAKPSIDIGIALGYEHSLDDGHLVGLRLGYDFNDTSPVLTEKMVNMFGEKVDRFEHDNLNFSLTYRYLFGIQ